MSDILSILQKQLDIEVKSAEQKLTASNLDTIYKLTSSIINMKRMNVSTQEGEPAPVYSNGVFDKNIDLLYDKYMTAKIQYRKNKDQTHKDELIESVRHLTSEMCDMIGSMLRDCECTEEKNEIVISIRRLSQM